MTSLIFHEKSYCIMSKWSAYLKQTLQITHPMRCMYLHCSVTPSQILHMPAYGIHTKLSTHTLLMTFTYIVSQVMHKQKEHDL